MAVAPPVATLVDTTKVDNLETGIDSIIGQPGWFLANVQVDPAGNPFWEGSTGAIILNKKECVVLRDRYLAVGWREVNVFVNEAQTRTYVRLYK